MLEGSWLVLTVAFFSSKDLRVDPRRRGLALVCPSSLHQSSADRLTVRTRRLLLLPDKGVLVTPLSSRNESLGFHLRQPVVGVSSSFDEMLEVRDERLLLEIGACWVPSYLEELLEVRNRRLDDGLSMVPSSSTT